MSSSGRLDELGANTASNRPVTTASSCRENLDLVVHGRREVVDEPHVEPAGERGVAGVDVGIGDHVEPVVLGAGREAADFDLEDARWLAACSCPRS